MWWVGGWWVGVWPKTRTAPAQNQIRSAELVNILPRLETFLICCFCFSCKSSELWLHLTQIQSVRNVGNSPSVLCDFFRELRELFLGPFHRFIIDKPPSFIFDVRNTVSNKEGNADLRIVFLYSPDWDHQSNNHPTSGITLEPDRPPA